MRFSLFLVATFLSLCSTAQIQTQIAAKQRDSAPWAIFPRTYHENFPMHAAVNPGIQNLDGYRSPTGAIGLDDIELVNNELTFVTDVQEIVEEKFELLIFPNPTNEGTNVIFGDGTQIWSCLVHDSEGRLVWRKPIFAATEFRFRCRKWEREFIPLPLNLMVFLG